MKKQNTGPELTAKLKIELEAEIKQFNVKKAKALIERDSVSKPDVNAYQDWLDKHEGREIPQANPDLLSEDDTIAWGRATVDPQVKQAMAELPTVLSPRELQVWRYVMRDGLSEAETGERLRIDASTVSHYLKSAKKKVEKHFK